jgi:hypothetical protein
LTEEYKDRIASLIVWGIFLILGGLLCAFMVAIMFIPLIFSQGEVPVMQLIPGMLVYVCMGIWMIWMGMGTLRARRWAQRLMLATSWLMLYCGIMAMGMMAFILPRIFSSIEIPEETVKIVMGFTCCILFVVYILLPVSGVLFYGNRNIRATIEHRDAGPSWTERCPLPVFILVISLLLSLISLLMLGFMNCVVPFFGILLNGLMGALILLPIGAICCGLAYGIYQQRPVAWWGVLTLLLLACLSQWMTFSQIDLMAYYEAMGYTEQMMQSFEQMRWLDESGLMRSMGLMYAVPTLIYLLCIKRFFKPVNEGE